MSISTSLGHFIDLQLFANSYQLVNIKVYNLIGEKKLSLWEELNKGENKISIDVSGLSKGTYRITISYLNEKLKEERFTLY
ncbi:T9SS type A sorting domain-containing protein [Cytophaga hutchinsonii]|uniref:Secretion system C-terminal sorting domain-containing protein n=1 Tax=Cytophaga hutchinsonii (strain ATCC 33406 / DSM 1761 / CIP 103989 / NBRC 15051 / NCIMB 9469 / D465) TaxID=269798 RepID=A0A6N4SWW3_CYTH3|nr:T9SS type A sorting domain-containing protein [Cytophaga hutchinsonii]ABG61047.1 hypothetical protein CHU_3815 [Cytophaga hutchinsonii ATCC 33406]SFX45096.1 Por secretion system C-terminal sorting domain-containing protein [Cytophaga hutchinsonii ATCC 33406]